MTLDITTSDFDVLPAARPAQAEAVGQLMAHAQAMSAAKQLADAMCDTDLVPAIYRGKPGNGAAAILYGAELGLTPIQSLQQIFVVHGTPAIYARTAVALVKRHGYIIQTVEESARSVTVSGSDPRTGQVEVSTWDIDRATTAGFTKNAKYQTEPQSMLWAKAAMEVCRRLAPDVLLGIAYASEELEMDASPPRKVSSSRRGVDGLRAALAPAQVVEAEPESPVAQPTGNGMSQATRRKWEASMLKLLTEADCEVPGDQVLVVAELADRRDTPPAEITDITDEELREVVGKLNAARTENALGAVITEILNAAVAREDAEALGELAG